MFPPQVCATGALVAILLKEGLLAPFTVGMVGENAQHGGLLSIQGLSELALDGFLVVDQVSLRALQIFQVYL